MDPDFFFESETFHLYSFLTPGHRGGAQQGTYKIMGKPLGSCLQRLAAGLRQRARGEHWARYSPNSLRANST